jgi:hypothetical protein
MSRQFHSSVWIPLVVAAVAFAVPVPTLGAAPTVTAVTLIQGTTAMAAPGTGVANLDAGNLVAGNTKWDPLGTGIYFNDTRVGFLWDPSRGATVFAEPPGVFLEPNFVFPQAVAANRTVVGGDVLREQLRALPFMWAPGNGFTYLPTPCSSPRDTEGQVPLGDCSGGAAAVSDNGSISVGTVYETVSSPSEAARWIARSTRHGLRLTLDLLARKETWSDAFDVSRDGTVIVGDSGPSPDALVAAKWVDGSSSPMDAVGTSSAALREAADGSASIGWAEDGGRKVLVRWAADGSASVFAPPDGTTIVAVHAINPTATAASGTLAAGDNWAPFLWTESGGFTVVPELNEPAYDRSEALDVSDDGSVVVGALQASVVSNGFPRSYGFLWSQRTGLVLITDLMSVWGQADADYYQASAISGDGLRVLAVGNPPGSLHDSGSVIVELAPY